MKRITLEEIQDITGITEYGDLYDHIMCRIADSSLKPLRASGINGKKPALYREYWQIESGENFQEWEEELKYRMDPSINIDYYLSHPNSYRQDRKYVLMLNRYLREGRDRLQTVVSANERSFEIWHLEKFLTRGAGYKILKRCGIEAELLNLYETTEPLSYYVYTRAVPQNILILENKDTFYSMRRYLIEGNERILGLETGTLIYGAGKGILRSFRDFAFCVEPYMNDKRNGIYYFGDMDYEGIGIYEKLAGMFGENHEILPFTAAYRAMMERAEQMGDMPFTKEAQNRRLVGSFFRYFAEEETAAMLGLLNQERYIPQEILTIQDFG